MSRFFSFERYHFGRFIKCSVLTQWALFKLIRLTQSAPDCREWSFLPDEVSFRALDISVSTIFLLRKSNHNTITFVIYGLFPGKFYKQGMFEMQRMYKTFIMNMLLRIFYSAECYLLQCVSSPHLDSEGLTGSIFAWERRVQVGHAVDWKKKSSWNYLIILKYISIQNQKELERRTGRTQLLDPLHTHHKLSYDAMNMIWKNDIKKSEEGNRK